jgi:hypothetical protein
VQNSSGSAGDKAKLLVQESAGIQEKARRTKSVEVVKRPNSSS